MPLNKQNRNQSDEWGKENMKSMEELLIPALWSFDVSNLLNYLFTFFPDSSTAKVVFCFFFLFQCHSNKLTDSVFSVNFCAVYVVFPFKSLLNSLFFSSLISFKYLTNQFWHMLAPTVFIVHCLHSAALFFFLIKN